MPDKVESIINETVVFQYYRPTWIQNTWYTCSINYGTLGDNVAV